MLDWLTRILFVVILLASAMLLITSLPTLSHAHMSGKPLMLHMGAGGALVVAMPLFGMLFLRKVIRPQPEAQLERFGFWSLMVTSLISIASVLLCMVPLLATNDMQRSMAVHGYAGFASVAAVGLLVIGGFRKRRIQATRSATPG